MIKTSSPKSLRHGAISRIATCAAVALVPLTATLAQPRYAVTELPTPAGYDTTVAYHINDQGFVVGSSTGPNDPYDMVATVWKNGTVTLLGKLKDGTYSVATAINSNGVTVGDGDDGDYRPLGWVTSGGKLVNFFSNNGGNTRPVAINEKGEIGGYYIKDTSLGTAGWRGAIWTVNAKDPRKSTKIDLPILPGGDPATASSVPFAFNESNQAAGYASNTAIGQQAAFWNNDAAHSIVDLGVFGSDWSSLGNGLNDLGQVVGSSHPPFGSRPVLWHNDPAHTAFELPLLPGHNYGSASLINNDAIIIGFSAASEPGTWNVGPSQIVIWIEGQAFDLQSLLDESGTGWTINQIMSLNNLGQLAGCATRNGLTRAVVLTPGP